MKRRGWKNQLTRVLSFFGGGSSSLLLSSVGIVVLVCLARLLGLWEGVELQALDLFLRYRPAETTDEKITILEITDADLQALGTYPVPDDAMVQLLEKLESYEPRVIGLDIFRDLPVINPVEPDVDSAKRANQALLALLQGDINPAETGADIVVIEKILNPPVAAPAGVPFENIGFADALLDSDGFVRRSLLASPSAADPYDYHLSFTIQLAAKYLAKEGFELNNGLKDENTMRFGETELFRFTHSSGGYHSQDTGENPVVLLNFRNHPEPFQKLSLSEFLAGDFTEEWIRDRIILIGMTAVSTKDYINSAAISNTNPGLVPGVEIQAHAISQIINAVLEDRPLIKTWPAHWEYAWIILNGIAGLSLIHLKKSTSTVALAFIGLGTLPIICSYGLILIGVWIPVVPTWVSYVASGGGVLFYRIHQYEQSRKIRFNERQRVLESSYNAIHNGPLQTLKSLTRKVSSQQAIEAATSHHLKDNAISFQTITHELHQVDEELRSIYEFMQREFMRREFTHPDNSQERSQVYLTRNHVIDLGEPLHELLYQVYHNKLQESESYFQHIKIKISDFCPMDSKQISTVQKEELLRFLEESLCNVKQHSTKVTRLQVTCKQEGNDNVIRVSDNGICTDNNAPSLDDSTVTPVTLYSREGDGSKQAKRLAKRLNGRFDRRRNTPKGTVCELIWPVKSVTTWKR